MMTPNRDWAAWRRRAVIHLHERPRELPRDPLASVALAPGPLVRSLATAGVRWILAGSAVLVAAGVDEVEPADLDVVPAVTPDNLERVAAVLEQLDAFPEPARDWEHGLSVDQVRRWRPHPTIEENLDHRFVTEHGILDVVPRLTGTYEQLLPGAWPAQLDGEEILAAELTPILARLRGSPRSKDAHAGGPRPTSNDFPGCPRIRNTP